MPNQRTKAVFLTQSLLIIACIVPQLCFPRVENLKRDAATGAVTHVFDDTPGGGAQEVAIAGYPARFSRFDQSTTVKSSLLDSIRQQVFLAESVNAGQGDRSMMVGNITEIEGQNRILLSTLTPAGHPLRDAAFHQVGQNSTHIVAVTQGARHQIHIFSKDDPSTVTTTTVSDATGTANGVIDNFIVLEDKIVVGVFENGESDYANNSDGIIRVLDMTGAAIGVAQKASTGNTLVVATSVGADDLESICGDKELRQIGGIHWDSGLERLFISFSRDDTFALSGDVMPYLVCRFSGNNLLAEGLAPLNAVTSQPRGIVSFRMDSLTDKKFTTPHMSTMADPSGRKYMVTNVNFRDDEEDGARRIFCVPLLSSSTDASKVGQVAKKDFSDVATAAGDFYIADRVTLAADSPALVGGFRVPVAEKGQITSMLVVGHTVLVSTNGESGAAVGTYRAQESGIWSSTALFDQNGIVKGWTPWARAMGTSHSVYGMHFDDQDGQLWMLFDMNNGTNAYADRSTFGVAKTELGSGNVTHNQAGLAGLESKLSSGLGNVISARHFPAVRTKGLRRDCLSVFGGTNKIFLAKTGLSVGASAGTNDHLEPYRTDPTGFDGTTDPYNADDTLAKLVDLPSTEGAVFCSEVARVPNTAGAGWLFVGTTRGLGVFAKSTGTNGNGAGWDPTVAGPTSMENFDVRPANVTDETADQLYLRELSGIDGPVLDLQARQETTISGGTRNFLYVLTSTILYRVELTQDKFFALINNDVPAALNPEVIFRAQNRDRLISLHMLPDSNCGFLLTTNDQQLDRSIPVRIQSKSRSFKLYQFNNIDTVTSRFQFADVSKYLEGVDNVAKISILPINQFNRTMTLPFPSSQVLMANLLVTTGGLSNPDTKIFCLPVFGTVVDDPKIATGLNKRFFADITFVSSAVLVSDLKSDLQGRRLGLGTNLGMVPFTYASTHRQDGLVKNSLLRTHHDGVGRSITDPNIRVTNSWTDSATGATVVAGNFGIRVQE